MAPHQQPHESESDNDSRIVIVSLEGCHGCGKTALCAEFEHQGFRILDEAFLDMPAYALHPQSLLMETSWVCSWFERVLRLANHHKHAKRPENRQQVYISDRSPFSAVFYSSHGHLLEPVIREQINEVQKYANVQFFNICVEVERELLWSRILNRLEHEPSRMRLNEHKRSWMEQTLEFYDSFQWDFHVRNDRQDVANTAKEIRELLSAQDRTFCQVSDRVKPLLLRSMASSDSVDTSLVSTDDSEGSEAESDDHSMTASDVLTPLQKSIIAFNNCELLEDPLAL